MQDLGRYDIFKGRSTNCSTPGGRLLVFMRDLEIKSYRECLEEMKILILEKG
jgi:hypothetical protein